VSERDEQFLQDAYALGCDADKKNVTGFYKRWAQEYNQRMEAGLGYLSPRTLAERLRAQLEPSPEQCIVDIGCGTGLAAKALAALGFTIIDGIDLSPDMLIQAMHRNVHPRSCRCDST